MNDAQRWLEDNFPSEGTSRLRIFWDESPNPNFRKRRNQITHLSIKANPAFLTEGSLKLEGFDNLQELNCDSSKITNLEIRNCSNLERIICSRNQLAELNFQDFPKLKTLICNDNKLTSLDLSTNKELEDLNIMNNSFAEQNLSLLAPSTKLKELRLGNNRFHDSLEPLKNISGLKLLDIRNTDISRGLEHLPESIDFFNCLADIKKEAQVKKIYDLFANEKGEVELLTEPKGFIKDFPAKLRAYKQKITEGIKDDKGKEIQQLKDKISELEKQLVDAKNEGQKDKQEIEKLKNQIKDLEGKLSSTDQAKDIEELKKTLDVNRKFTNTLSDNIVRLETEISELKSPGQQSDSSVETPQQIAQIVDNPPLKKD